MTGFTKSALTEVLKIFLLALDSLSSKTTYSFLHEVFLGASPEHKGLFLSPSNVL